MQAVGVERAAHDRVHADARAARTRSAAAFVSAFNPALAAAYTTVNDVGCSDAFELMLTMDPPAGMCAAASAVRRKGPLEVDGDGLVEQFRR